jgi:ADP-ribose pyrophosphatase YjhB (NUDIX family)
MTHNVKLVADVTILYTDKVLLVKYTDTNKYDHQAGWFLPDDLLQYNEHPEDAAFRIAREQLKMDINSPVLHHIESFTGNDKTWHMIFHFKAIMNEIPVIEISKDIQSMEWFKTNELPAKEEIAHHGWAGFTIEEILSK